MNAIARSLASVKLANPMQFRNLAMYPLLGADHTRVYLTLDDALRDGCCRVTEVSEAGSVPELVFENLAAEKILLLDGEELVGAKQNRVLNLTILVGGQLKIRIPVSCVEHGRWHYRSAHFAAGHRTLYARGRAMKTVSVSESLRRVGARRSDQGEVWDDIAAKLQRLNAASDSGAAGAVYETHGATLQEYVDAFAPVKAQVGAVFAVNGELAGLELFDREGTLKRVLAKVVTSYAVDALDVERLRTTCPPRAEVQRFVEAVCAAQVESFKVVGEGVDLRLASAQVVGAALETDDGIVHLSAFPAEAQELSERDAA